MHLTIDGKRRRTIHVDTNEAGARLEMRGGELYAVLPVDKRSVRYEGFSLRAEQKARKDLGL